jgi:hypothetical protein
MILAYVANASRLRLRKAVERLAAASPSDRVAGALILAGALLAATCFLTEGARSAGL